MARMRRQVPLAVRVPADQNEWLARESQARDLERSAFIREVFEDVRTCFGLPPADRDLLEQEATRQRLELRRFIGEVLRETVRALRATGPAVQDDAISLRTSGGPDSSARKQ